MSTTVTALANALDSLERAARELEASRADDPLGLKGPLAWGWHAVGLVATTRLVPERERFDAWLQAYLPDAEPSLDAERDARWEERQRLSFLELIDMLSDIEAPILKPEFYQGWQDRTSRCHGLRRQAASVFGGHIAEGDRQKLLLLLAAYHRLLRLPAGVELDGAAVRGALPALFDLVLLLLAPDATEAEAIKGAVERCRAAL